MLVFAVHQPVLTIGIYICPLLELPPTPLPRLAICRYTEGEKMMYLFSRHFYYKHLIYQSHLVLTLRAHYYS